MVLAKDLEIQTLFEKVTNLQKSIVSSAGAVKRALEFSQNPKQAQKRLKKCDGQLTELHAQIKSLLPQRSGSYMSINIPTPEGLYDRRLLDAEPEGNSVLSANLFLLLFFLI